MHPCPNCAAPTEGTHGPGEMHWAQCPACFADLLEVPIPASLWLSLCALHGLHVPGPVVIPPPDAALFRRLATAHGTALYWTETEAAAAGDVALGRCIHDVPLNVFCGQCEE